MKIKRILLTGVSVLAISGLSNCFLTEWLGEALDPVGSVSGAKAREIIQNSAADGYSFAGLTYTSSKTKVEKTTLDLSSGQVGVDAESTPGFGQRQTAFVKEVVKLAANIDPGQTYTAASVANCAAAVQTTSFAVALNQIESTDTNTAECLASQETFADLKFSEVVRGSCTTLAIAGANAGQYTVPALGTGTTDHIGGGTGATCLACMITMIDIAGGQTAPAGDGNSFYQANLLPISGTTSGETVTNTIIPWMNSMRTLFLQVNNVSSADGGNAMESGKDSCMEFYMAAVTAGAVLKKCAKIDGAGGITEATTLTGFVGGTSCELEPTGHIASTPWFNL